jgi:hypothetical protein
VLILKQPRKTIGFALCHPKKFFGKLKQKKKLHPLLTAREAFLLNIENILRSGEITLQKCKTNIDILSSFLPFDQIKNIQEDFARCEEIFIYTKQGKHLPDMAAVQFFVKTIRGIQIQLRHHKGRLSN